MLSFGCCQIWDSIMTTLIRSIVTALPLAALFFTLTINVAAAEDYIEDLIAAEEDLQLVTDTRHRLKGTFQQACSAFEERHLASIIRLDACRLDLSRASLMRLHAARFTLLFRLAVNATPLSRAVGWMSWRSSSPPR